MNEIELEKVLRRKRIAEELKDALREAGLSRKEFGELMHRQPSEVTKWLSGSHNFTSDLLAEMSVVLSRPISGASERPLISIPSSCVSGYSQNKAEKSLSDPSGAFRLDMDLSGDIIDSLSRKARSLGKTLREYVKDILYEKSQERTETASDFCGIWDDGYPDVEEIMSMRTQNTIQQI